MAQDRSAAEFVARLEALAKRPEKDTIGSNSKTGKGEYAEGDVFLGVRMGDVFKLAKEFIDMPPAELEILLESPVHIVRAGALSIMSKQAGRRSTAPGRRGELFDLYLRRTDRINTWDLVDVAAPQVIGGYLADKPRDVLYRLARSGDLWERRTALYATLAFIRKGDLDDAFALAAMLLPDGEDLIRKAAGTILRECGRHEPERLRAFLDEHAAEMAAITLSYATEHMDPQLRAHYRRLRAK